LNHSVHCAILEFSAHCFSCCHLTVSQAFQTLKQQVLQTQAAVLSRSEAEILRSDDQQAYVSLGSPPLDAW